MTPPTFMLRSEFALSHARRLLADQRERTTDSAFLDYIAFVIDRVQHVGRCINSDVNRSGDHQLKGRWAALWPEFGVISSYRNNELKNAADMVNPVLSVVVGERTLNVGAVRMFVDGHSWRLPVSSGAGGTFSFLFRGGPWDGQDVCTRLQLQVDGLAAFIDSAITHLRARDSGQREVALPVIGFEARQTGAPLP